MNKDVLEHIEDTVRDIMPLDARILLFGSRARGDARPDSDWDILIILNKNKRTVQDINDYACPLMDLGYSIGEEINPIVYTKTEWDNRRFTPLHEFVELEAIEICH